MKKNTKEVLVDTIQVLNNWETAPIPTQSKKVRYRDLINKSDAQMKAEALDLKEQKAKSQLEVTISSAKLQLAEERERLNQAICADPYSLENELECALNIEHMEKQLAYAQEVLNNRFW